MECSREARRKAASCHCYWQMCCWTKWGGSLNEEGHCFVHYDDDANVYVQAGQQVMAFVVGAALVHGRPA